MSNSNNRMEVSFGSDARTEATLNKGGIEVDSTTTKAMTADVVRRPKDAQDHSRNEEDRSTDTRGAALEDDELGAEGGSQEGTSQGEVGDEDGSTGEATELPAIEKFDPADAENVALWEKQYVSEDGSLNMENLSKEFWQNYGKNPEAPGMNEATYEFLASKGISKADAKKIEAMGLNDMAYQKQSADKQDLDLMTVAGETIASKADGADLLSEALAWGKAGGYSEANQKRFNKIMEGTDFEAKKEAVELLVGRYGKTDAFKTAEATRVQKAKPTKPERDATKSQGRPNPGVKPFADKQEWRSARKAAGGDPAKLREVDARYKVSNFG